MIGIKCAEYLCSDNVPARVSRCCPDAKFIVVLRNPIDRAVSCYFHMIRYLVLPPANISAGMRKLLDGDWITRYPGSEDIFQHGFYGEALQKWFQKFDRSRFHIVLYEEVENESERTLQQAVSFLGLDQPATNLAGGRKRQKSIYSLPRLRIWQLLRLFNSTSTGKVTPRFDRLSRVAWKGATAIDQLILARVFRDKKVELKPELQERLSDLYLDDVKLCESLLERPTGWLDARKRRVVCS